MADLQITDRVLLARILNLGENKQYPAMYQEIANSIKSGAIAVSGGVNSKMFYWYDQSVKINADSNESLSTQFIREVAAGGLKYQGSLPVNATDAEVKATLDRVSNAIGKGNYDFIKENKSLPNQTDLVNVDIGQALKVADVTPGGWGGSLFFWHEKFLDPATKQWTTIGKYILNTPGEREKFVEVTSVALAKVFVDQGLKSTVQPESWDFFKTLLGDVIDSKDVVLARLGSEVTNQAMLMFELSKLGFGKPGLAIDSATDSRQSAQNFVSILPDFFSQLRGAALNEVSQFVKTLSGYLPQDGQVAARALGLFDNEPLALDPATSGSGATKRVDSIWVATDLGNGGRLLKVSPSDPNTVVVLSSGVYQKLEIPDGKGGYLQVAIGDKTTDVTSWAGAPGQSAQLKRVLTTQTEAGQNSKTYQGSVLATESSISSQSVNGQSVQVTETVNHLAKGSDVASSKELVTSGGARIINSTTADGHIQEDTYATVNGKQTLQSSKIISYSQAERDTAALDVSLAGLELMQALRSGNKVQAAGSLIRLVNNAEIASNQMPTLGAIGTGFSGAVSLISALDSWGNASDGERIALTARAVLGANEVAKAFSANGQTGFLDTGTGFTALNVAGGIVALSNLDSTLKSGNPFAIASSVMALTNAAVATGMVSSATAAGALGTTAFSQAAVFGPQAMIAVAIASIVFGSLFGGSIEYPEPPPAGTLEIGALADGTLGMLLKDADGKVYQTRKLTGAVVSDSGKAIDNQDWGMGANVLSQRMVSLMAELQAQANKDGTHLVLDRLPTLSVHGYPSFERNGVDNFFFALRFNDPGTGAQQLMAAAHQDVDKQFKEIAGYAGAVVGNTEWAQIQAKKAAGDALATETEGQYVDRLSGAKEGDSVLTKAQADAQEASNRQSFSLLTLDLEGNGIARRAQQAAGMSLEDVQADTTKGITRLDVDNDGFMELTEWVGSKEAILGIDRNGDGVLSTAGQAVSSSPTETPRARATFSMLSSDMLRTCRSTWAMNVRCKSACEASSSCDHPKSLRRRMMFRASTSRAQTR